MEAETATVTGSDVVAPGLTLLHLRAETIGAQARPGQFAMVRCGEQLDPFLPRPFSIAGAEQSGDGAASLSLLVEAAGTGSRWLAARRAGDSLFIVGPCGKPMETDRTTRHLLLLSQGSHIAPLLFLAAVAVAAGLSVTLLQFYDNGMPPYPPDRLPPEVEVFLQPAAESFAAGSAIEEQLRWADEIVVAGDDGLLRQVSAALKRAQIRKPVQAVMRAQVPCGTGLCLACGVATRRRGSLLLCIHGPALPLRDLY